MAVVGDVVVVILTGGSLCLLLLLRVLLPLTHVSCYCVLFLIVLVCVVLFACCRTQAAVLADAQRLQLYRFTDVVVPAVVTLALLFLTLLLLLLLLICLLIFVRDCSRYSNGVRGWKLLGLLL